MSCPQMSLQLTVGLLPPARITQMDFVLQVDQGKGRMTGASSQVSGACALDRSNWGVSAPIRPEKTHA